MLLNMNNDAIINRLANITGCSRKQVLNVLKKMSNIPEVKKELNKMKSK